MLTKIQKIEIITIMALAVVAIFFGWLTLIESEPDQFLNLNSNQILDESIGDEIAVLPDEVGVQADKEGNQPAVTTETADLDKQNELFWHLKSVPIDVSDSDLDLIAGIGFFILGSEEGVNDISMDDMKDTLDRVYEHDMKMIVDAGFSAGAWGYKQDSSDTGDQKPVWQKDKMQNWVLELKDHPAVYGWDISNEAGENLPNGDKFRISLEQMKQAVADIRAVDKNHPIMIRMHYWEKWDEEDYDFDWKNPFDEGIADIVMLNLYSNYSEDGKNPLLPNMVRDSARELGDKILQVDPEVRIWLSLAAFQQESMFLKPTENQIRQDIENALRLSGIESIGFFGWGEPYDWYLPRDGRNLLEIIQQFI